MARRKSLEQAITEAVEAYAPRIARAYLQAMLLASEDAQLADMLLAIRLGDVEGAFRAAGLRDATMRPLVAMIESAFEAGGMAAATTFPKRLQTPTGSMVFRFDTRSNQAEKWLREKSSQLVTRAKDQTKDAIREIMFEGVKNGDNPKKIGLDITGRYDPKLKRRVGGVIGLDGPSARAVNKARAELNAADWPAYKNRKVRDKNLDRIVRKAWERGEKIPQADITRIVSRYKDGLLKMRGERIGRTEAIESLNHASHEAIKQADDAGAIGRRGVKRIWDSAGEDGRTRESHLAMEGISVGLDEAFTVGNSKMMFPGDTSLNAEAKEIIHCRCRVRIEIDWLAGVK